MADLNVSVIESAPADAPTPLLALPIFEGEGLATDAARLVDQAMGGAVSRVLDRADFRGKPDESLVLYPDPGTLTAERVVLVGCGSRDRLDGERIRCIAGTAVRQAQRLGTGGVAILVDPLGPGGSVEAAPDAARVGQSLAEGGTLAAWAFRELKSSDPEETARSEVRSLTLVVSGGMLAPDAVRAGADFGHVAARAENLARELATRPGNTATPTYLASVAESLAAEHGLTATILDRAALEEQGFGALLAVARGTDEEPRFIILEHRGGSADERPLVLVGKGVTFDSGGISIKPAQNMEDMKYDMSGAAAVLGAMSAVAALRLPVNLVGLIAATENLPSGRALKPGDVIRTLAGKTVEVINTDAEGRLILADALAYAARFSPQAILDAATLTGACVIALGHHAIGLMSDDDALASAVIEAADRAGQRCWRLPLWEAYARQLDSAVADIKNTGGRPAGTITAARFLKEFVPEGVPWVHLDIAGTAYRDEAPSYLSKGATGVPTRLFIEWVRARAGA